MEPIRRRLEEVVMVIRQSLAVCSAIAVIGCRSAGGVGVSSPVPVAVVAETKTFSYEIDNRPGRLTPEQFERVAGDIRTLVAQPVEVRVAVGESVRLSDVLQVVARDSLGGVLGELPYFDFSLAGRGFRLLKDGQVRFTRPGTVRVTVRVPSRLWRRADVPRPSVQAAVVASP